MRSLATGYGAPLCWLVLPLLMSGCSLLFSSSGGASTDAGITPNSDAKIIDGGTNADAATSPGEVMQLRIATNGAFQTFEGWKTARSGDLINRQLLRVSTTDSFNDQVLLPTDGGCSGTLRPGSQEVPIVDGILTIDLADGSPDCRAGDVLRNDSGDSATVLAAGERGVREFLSVFLDIDTGILLTADDFTTSSSFYVRVRAGTHHKGMIGDGVAISGTAGSTRYAVDIDIPYVRLVGFEVTNWPKSGGGSRSAGVNVTANHVVLDRLLVHESGDLGRSSDGIFVAGADNVTVRNSFVFNVARAGIHMGAAGSGNQLNVLSCSLASCMQEHKDEVSPSYACVSVAPDNNHSLRLINTVAVANAGTNPEFIAEFVASSSNNAAPQMTPFGTNSIPVDEATFAGFPTDLHLSLDAALGNTLEAAGTYLSGMPPDIDNQERPGPDAGAWPIGADYPPPAVDAGP